MTISLDAANQRPTLDKLLEAAPMLRRASRQLEPLLLAKGDAAAQTAVTISGPDGVHRPLTAALRHETLQAIEAGTLGYVELDVPMLAYEQRAGEDNRNCVGFRDGAMAALGRSGRGKPFLRDHEQHDSLARGGVLSESASESPAPGHYQIFQVARLTALWAVEAYLRGLLTTVSIGWMPTGPVLCTACNAPVLEKCWHFPGDRLSEIVDDEGNKRKVRKRDGEILVRWLYTAAELIETSCVPVPGVPTAEMDQLRATLSARFPGLSLDLDSDDEHDEHEAALKSPPPAPPRSVTPQPEITMADQTPADSAKLAGLRKAFLTALTMPEAHRAHAVQLSSTDADAAEAFCLESSTVREASVKAALDADPVVFRGDHAGEVRLSHGPTAKRLAELAEKTAAANKCAEERLAASAAREEEHEVETICSSQIPHLPGSAGVHANIVRALRKAGDPALLEESLKSLAGASNFVKAAGRSPGRNDEIDAGNANALEAFDTALAAFAKAAGKSPALATEAFMATPQGAELYAAYDQARRDNRRTGH